VEDRIKSLWWGRDDLEIAVWRLREIVDEFDGSAAAEAAREMLKRV